MKEQQHKVYKIKSDFQEILPEDCKQYNEIARRYRDIGQEDADEAFKLMKDSWAVAQRWSEIQATSRKIKDLSDKDFSVTAFKEWSHQRYRQMQYIHESSRMIWKQANEYLMWSRRNT